MRVGKVMGRVCLQSCYETLVGGRFLIVEVQDRFALTGGPRVSKESVVVYDNLGATDGDMIAFTESREATMPFYPEKRVPIDAFNAAILDHTVVTFDPDPDPDFAVPALRAAAVETVGNPDPAVTTRTPWHTI